MNIFQVAKHRAQNFGWLKDSTAANVALCSAQQRHCYISAARSTTRSKALGGDVIAHPELDAEGPSEEKSDKYSTEMQSKMGGYLTYRHEDGMNFALVLDELIVGSCLQTAQDLDRLVEAENVGSILCLQQDSDMEYFALDITPILQRVKQRGDVNHIRCRINDFDAFSLRRKLPEAAAILAQEIQLGRKAYVHCTAGMGRAPAAALAYMYWCRQFTLENAFEKLRAVRPCNPRLQAIRQATCDLLFDDQPVDASIAIRYGDSSTKIQVAGLDIGWGNRLDLEWEPSCKRHVLHRKLPPGRYPYKFIFGDRWTYSADHPTLQDGPNINNFVDVVGDMSEPGTVEARARLLSEAGTLTEAERAKLQDALKLLTDKL